MLSDIIDYKNSIIKKVLNEDKIDPGTFSFFQPGWWALHAAAITAIYIIANRTEKRI